ncbi:MAG: hypothetical protein MJ096_03705, partial [Clostridia bacterium]|nr:hypothetical protein [Clostridia bacterium]
IRKCRNGYDIAEADLKQRGPGDLFSENGVMRQHGKSSLTLASNCTDTSLIALAAEMASRVIERDPELILPENERIKALCESFTDKNENTMN